MRFRDAERVIAWMGLASTAGCQRPPPPPPDPPPEALSPELFRPGAPSGLCALAEVRSCALDSVGSVAEKEITSVKREQSTALIGWAADADSGTIPPVILVELASGDGKRFYAPASRATPPDGAETMKRRVSLDAGYRLLASFKDVAVGEYAVNIVQVNVLGNALACDTGKRLKVE